MRSIRKRPEIDHDWYERAQRHAAALEHRITALKHVHYPGCGYHYSWENQIKIYRERLELDIAQEAQIVGVPVVVITITDAVCIEGLTKEVTEAEQWLRNQYAEETT